MLEFIFLFVWIGLAVWLQDAFLFMLAFFASLMVYKLCHETLVMLGWRGAGE